MSSWAPLHHGTQDRQAGHKGPSLPGLFTLRGEREAAESRDREQRAAMMMDEGAAGRLQWTGLKGRSEALRLGVVRGSRCWQHDRLFQQESLK